MVEGGRRRHAAKVLVGKIHHRSPVLVGEGVAMVRVMKAEMVFRTVEFVYGPRGTDRVFHRVRQRNGIGVTFEPDEGPRGAKRKEPVFVKRQLFALPPKLMQVRRKPIR